MSDPSQEAGASIRLPSRVLFGAAYYHEYQPYPRLKADLDLMADAAFSVIRVGESVWSSWEPEDGVLTVDWLEEVLDAASDRDISVVLGTPTYAIPAWLARKYPEILAERTTGRPIPYGHRQNADYSHPAFRFHAERVVRAVVARYAAHPAVIGYQVDNEPGAELFHNRAAFEGFSTFLKGRYGSVDEVNRRWGLTYWSHLLSDWSDLWHPDGNTTQGYALEWRRYQASLTTDFITWQADIVRSLARPGQFVTTCIAYGRPGADDTSLPATLDVVSANPYYAMQDAFARPRVTVGPRQGQPPFWSRGSGAWWLSFEADLRRGAADRPFLVTETDAGSIGETWSNYPAYDGQWRQAGWTLVSRGAQMIEYWHWATLHHGQETYWGGVLGHSLVPGRAYAEIAGLGAEFATAGDGVTDLRPDTDMAFLRSNDSRWALEFQPPLTRPGSNQPDHDCYDTIFGAFYRGFNDAGLQAAVVTGADLVDDPQQFARRFPVLVTPALYVADDGLLEALTAYVHAGGHLISTFRTGYADIDGTARHDVNPGALRPTAGMHYLEYSNLSMDLPLTAGAGGTGFVLPPAARATAWADGIVTEGATVLAGYDHPHFGRWPAITTRSSGDGRMTWVGTLPDDATIAALGRWAVPEPANRLWSDTAPSVTVTGAERRDGQHLSFVGNWSVEPAQVEVPIDVHDLLSGETIPAGTSVSLTAWDIRVLLDAGSDPSGRS